MASAARPPRRHDVRDDAARRRCDLYRALSDTLLAGEVRGEPGEPGDRIGPLPVVPTDQIYAPSLLHPSRRTAGSSSTEDGSAPDDEVLPDPGQGVPGDQQGPLVAQQREGRADRVGLSQRSS